MPAILKTDFGVLNASTFFDAAYDTTKNLYIALARNDSYPWTNENVPPTPKDNIDDETDFRSKIIGYKKVQLTDLCLSVPRLDWTPGTEYFMLSTSVEKPKNAVGWYVMNSERRVYKLHSKTSPGILSVTEPIGVGVNVSGKYIVDTLDGYKWQYLYNITSDRALNLILKTWIPVNYNTDGVYPGGTITEEQNNFGDVNANMTLGASHVVIKTTIEDERPEIGYDVQYRQVGLVMNPRLTSDGSLATGIRYAAGSIKSDSGYLMYLENRKRVARQEGQSETVKMIITFG